MPHFINFSQTLQSLDSPLIMGILNVTDDSFYDGGRYRSESAMTERAGEMLRDGADIIDIGAMSTRPGAQELPAEEEENRVRQAVATVKASFPEAVVSIDTWRASVARTAVREGADMINDISGGTFDPDMIPAIGEMQVPYVLMHTPAKPDKMQQCTQYDDILADMLRFFGEQIAKLHAAHVHDIVIDPGFGFGKTLEQNYFLMRNLEAFKVFDLPILVGISRKSMIYKLLNTTPEHALNGTTVLNTLALEHGAAILRVHDVKEAVEVRKLVCAGLLCASAK
ncbi:MAG: dihydropteroate synthase [Bacteroidales bacterium]|nr:dihydropteroate synthase [Bacteroidales bacterium]